MPKLAPRRLILMCGAQSWGIEATRQLITASELRETQVYWRQPAQSALDILGQDIALVVIDIYQRLNPDVMGRASGAIVAGGALVLICPELDHWKNHSDAQADKLTPYPLNPRAFPSHYLQRWAGILKTLEGLEHDSPLKEHEIPPISIDLPLLPMSQACTTDQQTAIDAITKVVSGQRRRPAIITADRGRGKSAALGIAVGELIRSGKARNIVITSSGFNKVRNLFKHAQATLPASQLNLAQKQLDYSNACVRYIAPETLISETAECDCLVVDEAATLGVAMLERLLLRYPRIAFSSTEHGYEGSGRGFSLKFKQLIQTHCRGQNRATLVHPIRWGEQDPLERWMQQLLLLSNHGTPPDFAAPPAIASLTFAPLAQSSLLENEPLLQQIFQLLSNAHYQTRPIDLRYLLDAPNAQLWLAQQGEQIVGLAWLMLEGGLKREISREIVAGRRRPQGHLAPQILAAHLGLEDAACLHCIRIQRIVVEPSLQNKGVGSWMLRQLKKHFSDKADYLASSFGADLPLIKFWHQADFKAVRLSDQANAASGLRSAMVIQPLSNAAHAFAGQAQTFFATQLIQQLSSSLRHLDPAMAYELAVCNATIPSLDTSEIKAAVLFAQANRPYESSLAALHKLGQIALFAPASRLDLDRPIRSLFIMRTLQNRSWDNCAQTFGLNGKAACVRLLRQGSSAIIQTFCTKNESAMPGAKRT